MDVARLSASYALTVTFPLASSDSAGSPNVLYPVMLTGAIAAADCPCTWADTTGSVVTASWPASS